GGDDLAGLDAWGGLLPRQPLLHPQPGPGDCRRPAGAGDDDALARGGLQPPAADGRLAMQPRRPNPSAVPVAAADALAPDVVLSVRDLSVEYGARRGAVKAVRGVSFDLRRGESLALIGESGSGKTTLSLALIRLLTRSARVTSGRILYQRNGRV